MIPVLCRCAEAVALLGYFVAAVLYQQRLFRPQSRSTAYAHWGLLVGSALQGAGLIAHAGRHGPSAVLGQYANVAFVLVLLIVVGLLLLERTTERPALGAFLAPVVFLVVLLTLFEPRADQPLPASPWFISHIVLALLAYACFGVAFCMGMAYLVKDWLLKHKRVDRLPLLPALDVSDRTAHVAVALGEPIFTLGLGVGAAFLISRGYRADIKVALALVTWAVYAAYLFWRNVPRTRGRRVNYLLVVGFVLVLANLLAAPHHFPSGDAPGHAPSAARTSR